MAKRPPDEIEVEALRNAAEVLRNAANDNAGLAGKVIPVQQAAAKLKARPCPICSKPRVEAYRPFCSKHCADVDLGRWLHGTYAIPVSNDDDDEDGTGGEDERKP